MTATMSQTRQRNVGKNSAIVLMEMVRGERHAIIMGTQSALNATMDFAWTTTIAHASVTFAPALLELRQTARHLPSV